MTTILKQSIRITLDSMSQALQKCVLGSPKPHIPSTVVIPTCDVTTLFGTKGSNVPQLVTVDEMNPVPIDQAAFLATSTVCAQPRKLERANLSDLNSDERLYFEEFERWRNEEIAEWNEKLPIPFTGQVRITCDEILDRSIQLLNTLLKPKQIVCHGIALNDLASHDAIYTTLNAKNIKAIDRYRFANSMIQSVLSALEKKIGRIPKRRNETTIRPTYRIRRLVNGQFEAYRVFKGGAEQSVTKVTCRNQDLVIMELMFNACNNHEDEECQPTFKGNLFNKTMQGRAKAIFRLNKKWRAETNEPCGNVLDYDVETDICTVNCKVSEKVKFEDERGNFGTDKFEEVTKMLAADGTIVTDSRTRKKPSDSDRGNSILER